jgi:hypothetical protein
MKFQMSSLNQDAEQMQHIKWSSSQAQSLSVCTLVLGILERTQTLKMEDTNSARFMYELNKL